MKKYILFDLDGTLTDPKEGITKSVQYALDSYGIHVENLDDLICFIGPPLDVSFKEYYNIPDDEVWNAVTKMRERFATVGLFENRIYDGVIDMLEALKKDGKVMCMATSKPEEYAVKICDKYGISPYMANITGSNLDGTRTHKDEVIRTALERLSIAESDKESVIMVGDRRHDVLGSQKCGIESVGVRFGYAKSGELEEAGADYIVDTMDELKKFLLNI